MPTIEELMQQAETHEEPETTDKPHEDKKHVPEHVDLDEHTREGDDA